MTTLPRRRLFKGIWLQAETSLTAGKDLKVGKYTVLTADGSDSFNIRVNGLVREIKHGDVLILGEGDTFCPVSHTVVLR